jgi:pimeloyl-ACP methyl ester carboxylesterase
VRRVDEERHRQAERALWDAVGARPTERHVRLARTATTVRIQEVGSGRPVVFVHGASTGGTSWASLAARLDGFRCILLDRPGCGLSPRLDGGSSDMAQLGAFADDLVVDVLDAIGLGRAHVIGTSFGGYFVLRAAAAHPDRIDRLVALSWSFGAPMDATPLVMRIAMQPFLGRLATRIPPTERMARSLLKQIGLRNALESGRFGAVEMAWFLSLLRDTDTMRNEIDAAPRVVTMRGFNADTLLPASLLARITAPAYFLWGDEDPMGGPEVARRFVAQLPNAELELMPDAGHAPWMDDADFVARRVGAFLRG